MTTLEVKSFNRPDEILALPEVEVQVVHIAGGAVHRGIIQPGFRVQSSPMSHFSYVISGHLGLRMPDGSETEVGPGDIVAVTAGHDGWVVGDEPCITIDFAGAVQPASAANRVS